MIKTFALSSLPWQFREATRGSTWRKAEVPGCVHADLLRLKLIADPYFGTNELEMQWIEERDWEYRTQFDATKELLAEETIELVADGLDTVATVVFNGVEVARTENMFVGYRWSIRQLIKPKRNELRILFGSPMKYIRSHRLEHVPLMEFNDPIGGSTRIRKQACQFGWDWGPRLVTAGIWRDIRMEGWSQSRLSGVRIRQDNTVAGAVSLTVIAEVEGSLEGVAFNVVVKLGSESVASINTAIGDLRLEIPDPQLWWPNGHGEQPLYELSVEAIHRGDQRIFGRWARRIGLRTIVLDRHPDQWGESFQLVVNGRAIFAKGANWIPVDSLVAGLRRERYARDLKAAVAAHMNCIRLWGGGIYESEHFYDLCDELGLLVWHDFMFACTLYPSDDVLLASIREEAEFQVKRIRHHASLALWCGNNEIAQVNGAALNDPATRAGYEKLFHQLLPEVTQRLDGVTPYWPSSEWRGEFGTKMAEGEHRGDTHYWDVWHARKPVQDYEKWQFRFASEFGMQSYASTETMKRCSPPEDRNLFGPTSENHQKNSFGNQIVLDYVSRRYGCPRDQAALVYLSQLNQAYCMQVAIEHYRRISPRCMGALYWQINDCWPCASWSSIEHSGRWKALHFIARRFFAPALVSAHVQGDEKQGKGNYRVSTVSGAHLYTIYDHPEASKGLLRWDLFRVDGEKLRSGSKRVLLQYGESRRQLELDFTREIAQHTCDRIYLRIALDVGGHCVSEDSVFFAPPRFLILPSRRVAVTSRLLSANSIALTFKSKVFQHRFAFDLAGIAYETSDNFFELFPGEAKTLIVTTPKRITRDEMQRRLVHRSLADSQ